MCVCILGGAELSTEVTERRTDVYEGYPREAGKRVETQQVGGACTPTLNPVYM
jgi:hypothetical protein